MESRLAELSSAAAILDDLLARVTVAAEVIEPDREDISAALFEVERSLRKGARKLNGVLRDNL